jgi:hypothetical protein
VTWLGSDSTSRRAAPGPDAIVRAYNFHVLIEATMRRGASQWGQEFAPSLRHCEDYINANDLNNRDVYTVLLVKRPHRDVLQSVMNYPNKDYKLIVLDVPSVAKILETSILAFTIKHVDIRELFERLITCSCEAYSQRDLLMGSRQTISRWQRRVLKKEKNYFVGLKSYETIKRIGRNIVGASEILKHLYRHPFVGQYFNLIDGRISMDEIEQSLVSNSLATIQSVTYDGEKFFEPIPSVDFKNSKLRLIGAVDAIG